MITEADKLRFEIGEGFKNLSPNEICRNEALYNDISAVKIVEYGYDGDGPYYSTVEDFAECLLELYCDNEEDFIQAIGEHNDWNMFGWALSKISTEIKDYATKYLVDCIDGEDAEFIADIINDPSLPS